MATMRSKSCGSGVSGIVRGKFCGEPPEYISFGSWIGSMICRRPADDTYTDGLDESETKNGVREELATERGVAGDSVDEGGEDETDTDTGTGKTDGSGTHTDVLGDLNKGVGHLRGVGTLGLLGDGGGLGDLGALDGVEGGVLGDRYSIISIPVHISFDGIEPEGAPIRVFRSFRRAYQSRRG
jgi:hypothetical protein